MDRWLKNNTVVKIISLVIAIMLWMVVNINPNQDQVTKTESLNLDVIYDDNKYFVTLPTPSVQVEMKGDKSLFNLTSLLGSNKSRVFVDLSKLTKGTHQVPIQYDGFPTGMEVTIQPKDVTVTIEEATKVVKPVRLETFGKVKDGFVMGQGTVYPTTVTVSVPESKLQDLESVQALVNVDNATEDIDRSVEMRAVDKMGQPIRSKISPAKADVKIPVSLPFKALPLQLNFTGSPPPGYVISSIVMNPASVTVFGPQDILSTMPSYLGPAIDLSRFTASDTVKMKIPLYNKISKTNPDMVEITVNVSNAVTGSTIEVPIKLINIPAGRTAQILKPGTILQLQVQGTAENIAKLTKDDIQATIDVSSLGVGDQNVVIQVKAPYTIKVVNPPDSLKAVVRIQ